MVCLCHFLEKVCGTPLQNLGRLPWAVVSPLRPAFADTLQHRPEDDEHNVYHRGLLGSRAT
jgi:hypothetical protein